MFPALSSFFPFSRRSGRFRDSRWPDQDQVWLKTQSATGTPSLSGFEGLFAIGRLCTGALWYEEVRLLSWYLTSLFEKQMQGSHSNFVSYFQKYYYFIIDQLSHLKCKIIEASKTRTFQKCAFTHHQKVGEEAMSAPEPASWEKYYHTCQLVTSQRATNWSQWCSSTSCYRRASWSLGFIKLSGYVYLE